MITTGFSEAIADRIAAEHASLAAQWFARLHDLLPVGANEVFPSDSLLDHIPTLIVDISTYLRSPETEAIAANTMVAEKARELGALRHQQRASLHQVLREYQLLCTVLLQFVEAESSTMTLNPAPAECVATIMRLHQAVNVLLQETVETFVGLYTRTITDQTERLRQFTRMATHEWRQPLAPIAAAASLLRLPGLPDEQRNKSLEMISRNVARLSDMTFKLERVARLDRDADDPTLQRIPLDIVATQATDQLREMAAARGVELRLGNEWPVITVDVGQLELAIVNLLSNAIKYCDPHKAERYAEVTARRSDGGVEICVRDNGIGIPADRIDSIFERFTRAHADRGEMQFVSGIGLGLAIVDDCVKSMGGHVTVESREGAGTMFCLHLPASATAPD